MTESTSPAQPERRSRRPITIAIVALLALIGGCASWRIPRYIDDKVGRRDHLPEGRESDSDT